LNDYFNLFLTYIIVKNQTHDYLIKLLNPLDQLIVGNFKQLLLQ
jgi:hypothetical protein